MANLKGRCVNVGGGCSKALSKEIIEADEYNFVCPECGRNLVKIQNPGPVNTKDTNKTGDKDPGDKRRKLIIILSSIALLVIVVLVILGFTLGWFGGKKSADINDNPGQEVNVTQTDVATPGTDESTSGTDEATSETDETTSETNGQNKPGKVTNDGGKDEGPEVAPEPVSSNVFGGAATRKGNVITFNKPYRINLHTLDKDYIDVPANAKIISCIFDGNYLIQGELVIKGESQLLSGIKEKLK